MGVNKHTHTLQFRCDFHTDNVMVTVYECKECGEKGQSQIISCHDICKLWFDMVITSTSNITCDHHCDDSSIDV